MTNFPEAALRALANRWRHVMETDGAGNYGPISARTCAHELEEVLRQIEAAPSPPDSSQGEPVAWRIVYPLSMPTITMIGCPEFVTDAARASSIVASLRESYPLERIAVRAIPLYTTPPPSSPQVAVADGLTREQIVQQIMRDACEQEPAPWDGEGTICIDVDALQMIVEAALFAPAAPQSAPKAAEPQHWKEAVAEVLLEHADDIEIEALELNRLIEQRARSLAQAEQAAKGEG